MAKASTRRPGRRTRHLTFNVTVEVDVPERMAPLVLKGLPGLLDDLRGDDDEGRQIRALWGVIYDGQHPVAEYQYLRSGDGAEHDVREVRIADRGELAGIGYGGTKPPPPAAP